MMVKRRIEGMFGADAPDFVESGDAIADRLC